uniref:AAA ATPase, central domain protein n=1 Tax=Cereibacter sphaeroides (strain ATCC 17025 / ATH 2.4.3) TaxID=349102 RepID=A4WQQ0_CERS5
MSEHPLPAWSPFASEIIQRLRYTLTVSSGSSLYNREVVLIVPDEDPALRGAGLPSPEADLPGYDLEGDETGRGVARGSSRRLSAPQCLHALRLAATFGTRETFRRCLAPGAVTVIGGLRPDEVRPLSDLLRLGLLPPGYWIHSRTDQKIEGESLLLLSPVADGDVIAPADRRSFHERLSKAFDAPLPVLILCPDEARPPESLARYLPEPLVLARVDRSVMLHHLRLSYGIPDDADLADVHAALPGDRALAGLSLLALSAALRAPTAWEAARRLSDLLLPVIGEGPRLEHIAGDGEALKAARRLVADLGLWQEKKLGWNELCRSLLLYGPPGTGKTWLARAMGNSADVGFVAASFAQWQAAGHLGDMLAAMRKSFADARRQAPSILFIEEIDAVGSRLDSDRHASNYRHQVIAGFLETMDSLSREEGVIVVGACNYPERIDPAVLRAGRFDLKVEVPLPDEAILLGILLRHLRGTFTDTELRALAQDAVGCSAAEVDAAIRQARALAREEDRPLMLADIRALLVKPDAGAEAHRWRCAVHECGHAIVGAALDLGTIERVMLTRQGGHIIRRLVDRAGVLADYEAELAYAMAGRAAERLVLGEVSGGAGGPPESDLAQATRIALSLDMLLGLGAHGPVWSNVPLETVLRDTETRARVRARIEAAEASAEAILGEQMNLLQDMARALAQERLLRGDALAGWLAQVAVQPRDGGQTCDG